MSDPIDTWLKSLAKGLHSLPEAAQDDILAELRVHIAERLEQGFTPQQVLGGFGDARAFALCFRPDTRLDGALAGQRVAALLGGLVATAGRSITAAFALVAASICALLAIRIAGLFGEKLGLLAQMALPFDPAALVPDIGLWLFPAGLGLLFILWLGARLSLSLAVSSLRLEPVHWEPAQ